MTLCASYEIVDLTKGNTMWVLVLFGNLVLLFLVMFFLEILRGVLEVVVDNTGNPKPIEIKKKDQ